MAILQSKEVPLGPRKSDCCMHYVGDRIKVVGVAPVTCFDSSHS